MSKWTGLSLSLELGKLSKNWLNQQLTDQRKWSKTQGN